MTNAKWAAVTLSVETAATYAANRKHEPVGEPSHPVGPAGTSRKSTSGKWDGGGKNLEKQERMKYKVYEKKRDALIVNS